jgi:DNA repair protein RadC
LTETLQRTLRCLDIPVLDHVIVAGGQRFSFAEHGLL